MDKNPNEQPKEAEVIDILTRRARVEKLATPSQELSGPEHLAEVIELKPKPRSKEGVTQIKDADVLELRNHPLVKKAAQELNRARMDQLIEELVSIAPSDIEGKRSFLKELEERLMGPSFPPNPPKSKEIPDIYA